MADEPTKEPSTPPLSVDMCDSHTVRDAQLVVSCFYGSWRHTGLGPTLVHRPTDPPLLFPSEQLEPPAEDMKDCLETAVRFAQRLILGPALDTVTSLLAPPADHPAVRRALKEEVAGLKLRLFVDWRLPMQVFGFHPPAGGEYGALFEDVLFINQWLSVSVGLLQSVCCSRVQAVTTLADTLAARSDRPEAYERHLFWTAISIAEELVHVLKYKVRCEHGQLRSNRSTGTENPAGHCDGEPGLAAVRGRARLRASHHLR